MSAGGDGASPRAGLFAPLATPVFRRVWLASMFSNTGLLIQGVGAAWAMVRLSQNDPVMVTLVQTSLFLPIMLLSMVAGALADAFDRRKVALAALTISLTCATGLAALAFAGMLNAHLLLIFSFGIGVGMAIFGPTWQAAVSEQVPANVLAQAVALNSISFNLARSFGPAVGGLIVATGGAMAAFSLNALFYLPMIGVLMMWRGRAWTPARLPPEKTGRAIWSGLRFIAHAPSIRNVLIRTFAIAVPGSSVSALMPLIAHDVLRAGAQTYGVLLGAIGIGAIIGGALSGMLRDRFTAERLATVCALIYGACAIGLSMNDRLTLTLGLLVVAGTAWMLTITQFNIIVQLAAPRWVMGRALAAYQAIIAGGLALGSLIWGSVAMQWGVANAVLISGVAIIFVPLLFRRFRLANVTGDDMTPVELDEVDVALRLEGNSGPIAIEIGYDVNPGDAGRFYQAILGVERIRVRNGAYDWSVARDMSNARLWTERFQCPTWHDYLRMRDRNTQTELDAMRAVMAFDTSEHGVTVRRWHVRPTESVSWRDDLSGLTHPVVVPPTTAP